MFKRIEIIGYAGSGKSTIYSHIKSNGLCGGIRKREAKGKRVYRHEEARRICSIKLVKEREANSFKRNVFIFILRFYYLDRFLAFSRRLIYQKYDLLHEIDGSEPDNMVLSGILKILQEKLPFNRFLDIAYKFRMRLIDLYLFKKYMNRDSVIIQDEFFLQSSSFGPEEMLYYAENMPDLEGVVILEPKAEIIDRRIIGRKKIHYLHRNYAKESDSYEKLRDRILPEYEKKLDGIKKSGTRILLLDIEQSPEDNAEKILEFSLNS